MTRVRTIVAAEVALLVGLFAVVVGAWLVERGFGLERPLALGPALAAAVAGAPALLWLGYFHAHDRLERAPKHHVVVTFLIGAFVAAPIAEHALGALLAPHPAAAPDLDPLSAARLVRGFLVVAVIQELATFAAVRYTVYRTRELDAPLDGIVYATAAGLGYASFLAFRDLGAGDGEVFLSVAAARVVVLHLAHACFAAVLGHALGVAKFAGGSPLRRASRLAAGLALAIALDGQFVVVSDALAARGLDATPWRAVAYGFGFAAVVFVAMSPLIRRLVTLHPTRERA